MAHEKGSPEIVIPYYDVQLSQKLGWISNIVYFGSKVYTLLT